MAFENHQQDAFNLRNDTESLKQWQSELDKATTSIGAAEVAAEEELAALKFKNLSALQDARVAKLEQLIALEDKGIRELARARLTLSNRQFELRKKEIQREFRLLKAAADKLQESDKKTKKPEAAVNKQTARPKKDETTSKAKSVSVVKKDSAERSKKATGNELNGLAKSFDKTLSSLQNTATKPSQVKDKSPLTNNILQPAAAKNASAAMKTIAAEAIVPKINELNQQVVDTYENTHIKDSEEATSAGLISIVGSIDKTVTSIYETIDNHFAGLTTKKSSETAKQSSTTEEIKKVGNVKTTDNTSSNNGGAANQGGNGSNGGGTQGAGQAEPPQMEEKDFTSDSGKMKAVSLGDDSLTHIKEWLETNRASENPTKALVDQILKAEQNDQVAAAKAKEKSEEPPEANISQTTLDLTSAWLKSVEATSEAEAKLNEFNSNIEWNSKLAFLKKEQDTKLRYLNEYQAYLEKAGKHAISREEFEKERARQDRDNSKKEAANVSKILSDLQSGKFNSTEYKKAASLYKGQRTAELKEKYNNEKLKDDGTTRRGQVIEKYKKEGLSDKDAQAKADAAAEASAKLTANFELLAEAAGGLAATLDAKVKEISAMQGIVDTRLQGSRSNDRDFGNGSYWNELLEDAKKIASTSPFVKQEKLVDNIKVLVERGISFDIKQRAFLMTVQEKIANTFNVADGTLLRLIRIQQQDTTAGRLGMESALNSFLNSMYETSEYLEGVAANVRGSLEEMQALMEGAAGTELEFQVQKWMGSLYSVGMSQDAVQSIAQTFGQIASGDISGLTGSGTGNLLIMAVNEAGMSIADILQDGLNADETNKIMQAMVNYLAEIAETSSDSRVVQQQLANVYGVKASDLRAATNLATSIKEVSNQDLTYGGMLGQLEHMMNTLRLRTSIGEGMTNMWDNVLYSMASTQASNPILYALPKMADLLRDVTGGDGIALPFVNVMGFGVDLNTSVADLMSVASMAGTALGTLGPLLRGLDDLVNPMVGSYMLRRAGINTSGKAPVIARGSAQPLQHLGGSSISESGLVGNADGKSIKEQTLQGAADDKKKQMIKAKDEESADDTATKANFAVVNIYHLLEEVAHGSQSLRVRVINSGTSGGSSGGPNYIIGDDSGTGSTGAGGRGTGSADNGNWVLTF